MAGVEKEEAMDVTEEELAELKAVLVDPTTTAVIFDETLRRVKLLQPEQ